MKRLKVLVVAVVCLVTGLSVSAQEVKSSRAQSTTLSAKAVTPKAELLPEDFCDPKTVRQTRGTRAAIRIACDTPWMPTRLTASSTRPDARAKITGHCKEVDGSIKCDWACAADDKSDCGNFITNCVGEGGTVEGNKGAASCKP